MKDFLPTIRGLNAWTLKQKIKDRTTQRISTIQLLHNFDIYHFTSDKREELAHVTGGNEIKQYINEYGELKRKTGLMPSHSFVLQFMQLFEASMAHVYGTAADTVSIKDTSNTARSVYAGTTSNFPSASYWSVETATATTTYGIQIGTGITAPASTDYVLQTPIAHGVGAGQLQWNSCGVGSGATSGANVDMAILRTFTNGSGGSITAREIGIVVSNMYFGPTQGYFLIAHDAVNQAIADAETAVVAYTVRTTV